MQKYLIIDPGVPFGYATFTPAGVLLEHGERRQANLHWQLKTDTAADQFRTIVTREEPVRVYCEEPFYIPGHAAADSGSLVKLAIMVGRLVQVCHQMKVPCTLIPVREWMGQMTPVVIRHRIAGVLGNDAAKKLGAHDLDAVGIGLHVTGRWPK